MRNSLSNWIYGISLIIAATIGFVAAKAIHFPQYTISETIDIVDIFSLLATIGLAILITTVLEKKGSDNRSKKELVINRIGNLTDIASGIQLEAQTGKVSCIDAASSIKRINTALDSIYRISKQCDLSVSKALRTKLNKQLADLRETLTKTPRIRPSEEFQNLSIEVREGMIYYNNERVAQIEVKFDGLKDILLELQIEINGK